MDPVLLLVVVLVVVLVVGRTGFQNGWDGRTYGGGLVGLVLIILLIVWLLGGWHGGPVHLRRLG